jgi:hypothetical protein
MPDRTSRSLSPEPAQCGDLQCAGYLVGITVFARESGPGRGELVKSGHGGGNPVFLPRDESIAWAWLPPGTRNTFDFAAADTADIHFAWW